MANILITGTSRGFGFSTVKTLIAAGHDVAASMRKLATSNADRAAALRDAAAAGSGKLHLVEIDVSDDGSVERGVGRAHELLGQIDVLINNAGSGGGSYLEAYTTAQVRELFEVNVFGVHRMCRAVLPDMRARKQGLIINLSSGLGRFVVPFNGAYGASKFAVESLSESFALELAPTGVEVIIVEPGPFPTEFFDNMAPAGDEARLASYGELADRPAQMWEPLLQTIHEQGPDPQLVADKIAELIAMPVGQRPLRTVVDPMFGNAAELINAASEQVQAQFAALSSG